MRVGRIRERGGRDGKVSRPILIIIIILILIMFPLGRKLRGVVYQRVLVCVDGLAPPIDKWQKAVNQQLQKIKKLEEIYENELILKKVGGL